MSYNLTEMNLYPLKNERGFGEELIEFRTVYVRSIVRAWSDQESRKKFCDPFKAFEFMKNEFQYNCPWDLQLSVLDEREYELGDGSRCMYTPPAWNANQGRYIFEGGRHASNILTLYVPTHHSLNSEALTERMESYAEYYQQCPGLWRTLNGALPREYGAKDLVNPVDADEKKWFAEHESKVLEESLGPNAPKDLGDDPSTYYAFGAIMFNALVLMEDSVFRKELLKPGNAIKVLKDWLDYEYPWNIGLLIEEDPTAEWDKNEKTWKNLSTAKLQLVLPKMPDLEAARPLALTKYNQNGPAFPFTCT